MSDEGIVVANPCNSRAQRGSFIRCALNVLIMLYLHYGKQFVKSVLSALAPRFGYQLGSWIATLILRYTDCILTCPGITSQGKMFFKGLYRH